jgi:hypothetical protein
VSDEEPKPLDYASPAPPTPRKRLAVAKRAWLPGEENKALAEGCATVLILPFALLTFGVVAVIVLVFLLYVAIAISR